MAQSRSAQDAGAGRGSTGVPRWVKVSAVIAAIVLVAVLVVMLLSGGNHGPGRHVASGEHPRTSLVALPAAGAASAVAIGGRAAPQRRS